ncbi:hypothetical protein HELRODRAFT_190865 [Helobdella robusta]|uniref:FK506-binding protein n=1 Tax=Helobdella robusta TaxID=6412 RepID=T1FSD3_HELRO|nr:hypothetical protein HELRODRAFT_190865 [Helobdella robusta]ESO08057.1 hypothetical protein HELRODRAFT_190865 [Helobdella robusta]
MVVLKELANNIFWGVCLESGKKYTQTPDKNFHISMAAIDPSNKASTDPVSVILERNNAQFVLCSLVPGILYQQALDLNFSEGEELVLYTKGKVAVHLTGYVLQDDIPEEAFSSDDEDDEDYDLEDEEEEEEEDEEAEDLSGNLTARKRKIKQQSKKLLKKAKMDNFLDDEAEEADEDDMEDDFEDEMEMAGDSDGDDDEEEEEEEEDGGKKKQNAKQKKGKKAKESNAKPDESKSLASAVAGTPGSEDGKKKKKKKKKKNKQDAANESAASDGSKAALNDSKQAASPANQKQAAATGKNKKVTAEGGVIIEEVKEGHGPVAKLGKHVKVYYTGKLQSGKIFDTCVTGNPFKFKLGKKEVIAGWDVGLDGMKVGGKRTITIPPKMGYGSQKVGSIPANSTLIFDIELKAVL